MPIKLELTQVEWETLVLAMGYAAGAASRANEPELCHSFMGLARSVMARVREEGPNAD